MLAIGNAASNLPGESDSRAMLFNNTCKRLSTHKALPALIPCVCRWLDANNLRYVHDEAARFEVMFTIGMMALNARPGHAGLPFGHITTYKVR